MVRVSLSSVSFDSFDGYAVVDEQRSVTTYLYVALNLLAFVNM